MPAFADATTLASYLGGDVDQGRAGVLLDIASDAIRARLHQRIDYVADDVVTLDPEPSLVSAFLPELPVVDVSAVAQLGRDRVTWESLTPQEYEWSATGLVCRYRAGGRTIWPAFRRSIRVTYSHGFQEIPGDLKAVTVTVAARIYENPLGVTMTNIGTFHEQFGGRVPGIDFTDMESLVLDRYAMARIG